MKALIKCMIVSVFVSGCARKEATIKRDSALTRLDSVVALVPDFNGVILVSEKGRPVYHKAFGFANQEANQKNDTTTIFELASVSKQFTAMLIVLLKEEGKLNYDDAVEKYLPDLPYKNITIRHLLTHTSGLPDYQKLMDEKWDKSKVAGNADILSYLKKYHPVINFKPGEKYEYSNTGYVLLGSIVEKASGKDFVIFMHEKIFDPLGMTSTDLRSKAQKDSLRNFALGYIFVPEKKRFVRADSFPSSNYTIWLGARKGPGRISSTTSDLLKWDAALYSEKLIANSAKAELFTPARLNSGDVSNYGFGWVLKADSVLGKVVYHTGDNPGYKTEIIRYVDKQKTVIVLCNNAHEKFDYLIKLIEEQLRIEAKK
ncbi:MAG: beta-lactamase family protein [Bacteroidetes bacterium]|nr:beta-lactamase family protein [Bacteroidota bacterium]